MSGRPLALLVHPNREPVNSLAHLLDELGIFTRHASNCREAAAALKSHDLPHLVFSATLFEDGGWEDVVSVAGHATLPVNVIVVASQVDINSEHH